ncbi:MAG TPA: hypothetical protein VIS49_13315 [Cyclobacteriaceae bacterium]
MLIFSITLSCTHKPEPESGSSEDAVAWKEMDEFHMVMAESFHPFRDSANLEPVKMYAAEMTKLAEQWTNSELPTKVNTEEVKYMIEELEEVTNVLADLVEAGDDDAIGTALTNVHDSFHRLQEAWYKNMRNQ